MHTQRKSVTILLSMLATLALLFGGWFLYQKMEVEEPIRTAIEEMKSAQLAQLQVDQEQVAIQLSVTRPDLFPHEYRSLWHTLEGMIPNKQVAVSIANQKSSLEQIWTNGIFAFTEAVDLHEYSKIPVLVKEWKRLYALDEATTQMDDAYVYVYLKNGSDHYYAVVPRYEKTEVTPNG